MRHLSSIVLLLALSLCFSCASNNTDHKPDVASSGNDAVPFMMFQGGKGKEAMDFYTQTFPDGEILKAEMYGTKERPGPEGTVYWGEFIVGGQKVRVTDSPIPHDFNFTPSFSLFVNCMNEAEIVRLVKILGEGGKTMMPLDNYGFSKKFAWVEDRFGISWQLNLPD